MPSGCPIEVRYGAYRLVRHGFADCKAITGDYSGLSIMSLNNYLHVSILYESYEPYS